VWIKSPSRFSTGNVREDLPVSERVVAEQDAQVERQAGAGRVPLSAGESQGDQEEFV
jgi:hypothetical protein